MHRTVDRPFALPLAHEDRHFAGVGHAPGLVGHAGERGAEVASAARLGDPGEGEVGRIGSRVAVKAERFALGLGPGDEDAQGLAPLVAAGVDDAGKPRVGEAARSPQIDEEGRGPAGDLVGETEDIGKAVGLEIAEEFDRQMEILGLDPAQAGAGAAGAEPLDQIGDGFAGVVVEGQTEKSADEGHGIASRALAKQGACAIIARMHSIRKARLADLQPILGVVNEFARDGLMLPLSVGDLTERLRDFLVAEAQGRIVGSVAVHITWDRLVELRSLAVTADWQKRKLGGELVAAALAEARSLGADRIFTLTYIPGFFARHGFVQVERASLPHKVWQDCTKCPKFPDCGETAMVLDLA